MGKTKTKLDLVIGAWDRFSGPMKKFDARLAHAGDGVKKFSANMAAVSRATGLAKLSQAIGNVGGRFANLGEASVTVFGRWTKALGILSIGLGGLSGGLVALSESVGMAGVSMDRFATRSGVNIDTFQRLAYAAKLSGMELEDFGPALEEISIRATDAVNGNADVAMGFKSLGISVVDANGKLKGSEKLLLELADAFSRMEDGTAKTGLTDLLLGGDGMLLLPLLNQGSAAIRKMGDDAEHLGIIMGRDGVDNSKQFMRSLSDAKSVLQGLGFTVGVEVMPIVSELLKEFSAFVAENRGLIGVKTREWAQRFAESMPAILDGARDVVAMLGKIAESVAWLSEKMGGAENLMLAVAAAMSGPIIAAIASLTQSFFTLGAAIMTTPVGWIAAAVAALAGAAYLVWDNWQPIKEFFIELGETLANIMPDWMKKGADVLSKGLNILFNSDDEPSKRARNPKQTSSPSQNVLLPSFGVPALAGGNIAFAPSHASAELMPRGQNVNATTSTHVERHEVRLILPQGVRAVGGENAKGVTIEQTNLGSYGVYE